MSKVFCPSYVAIAALSSSTIGNVVGAALVGSAAAAFTLPALLSTGLVGAIAVPLVRSLVVRR